MDDEAKRFFEAAFDDFLNAEGRSIVGGAHEQNLCGQLALRLESRKAEFGFSRYHVDTECNRMLFDVVKKIFREGESVEIRSDVVVHIKGKCDNLIAIEVKKADRSAEGHRRRENDRLRLMAMTTPHEIGGHPEYVCGYKLGLFIELDRSSRTYLVEEFRNGGSSNQGTGTF
jgi:hypothetical protein